MDLRKQYLIEKPFNPSFLDLKSKTPARLGMGRAGARYRTETMLRMRADHAAAQDSVFSLVAEEFPSQNGFVPVQTLCESKDEYLTRPDRGRRFNEEHQAIIKNQFGHHPKVALVLGDGLSTAAVEAKAKECRDDSRDSLKTHGMNTGPVLV